MQVFQDIVLPINQLEQQIDVSDEIFDTYPILVYPCRIYDHGPHRSQLRPPRPDQMCPDTNWGNIFLFFFFIFFVFFFLFFFYLFFFFFMM